MRIQIERWHVTTTMTVMVSVLFAPATTRARPQKLPVPKFRTAAYVAPKGEGKRPVVVALHGNFDRPEWNCEVLPSLVQGRAWILCLRGIPRKDAPREWDRWTYPGRARVMKEIKAGLAALQAKFPGRVDVEGPILLAGFSLGSIYSARYAVGDPSRFPRLYLVEGSHKVWTRKAMRRFARKGGKAVVFGCGRRGCGAQSRRICRGLKRLKVRCWEVTVPGLGHSYTDPLPGKALPLFNKMIADDPRWGS
jgi:pimeloyl-ACP methyl ester carboxylesterase